MKRLYAICGRERETWVQEFRNGKHGCSVRAVITNGGKAATATTRTTDSFQLEREDKPIVYHQSHVCIPPRNWVLPCWGSLTSVNNLSSKMMSSCCETTQSRLFHSEGDFHTVADETLERIQDAVEDLFDSCESGGGEEEVEVNLASGVLTIGFGRHGTWVINKQTPNRQIWWSSPISGPRRYEFVRLASDKRGDDDAYLNGYWTYSRSIDDKEAEKGEISERHDTLGEILTQEIRELYGLELELDL